MTCTWRVNGSHEAHERVARLMLKDPEIREFHSG